MRCSSAKHCARCTHANAWSRSASTFPGSVPMAWLATAPNVTAVDRRRAPRRLRRRDFWEPMHSRKERNLILDPDEFYILASKGAVQVLPDYSAEMVPFDPLVGEFRVYYAGSSATRAPAGAARARCWRCARAKCRSSSSTEEPKQFVA